MRSKNIFILIVLVTQLLTSCKPNLDLNPLDGPSINTYYKTQEEANAAVLAVYGQLRPLFEDEIINTPNNISSDDAIPFLTGNADRVAIWNYNITPSNTFLETIWRNSYNGIQRSNIAINRIPTIEMNNELKIQYLAEAKFLRALNYFNLVRFFGGVPIVSREISSLEGIDVPKNSLDEVYDFIVTELNDAKAGLPETYQTIDIGRATRGSAFGLLAKVYLTRAGTSTGSPFWSLAAQNALEVIKSGNYKLWDNFSDVYTLANRGGKESLFEAMFITDLMGNNHNTGYAPRGAPIVPGNGSGILRVSKSLFDAYEVLDKRKAVSFLTSYKHPTNGSTINLTTTDTDPAKAVSFWKLSDNTAKVAFGGGKSFPILRYADILLIYAEALNEANGQPNSEAYEAINEVRKRAGLDALAGLDYGSFKDAVLLERRLEFCFEGNRLFDLRRTAKLKTLVDADTRFGRTAKVLPHHYLFPIPQREIDANSKLIQNDGY